MPDLSDYVEQLDQFKEVRDKAEAWLDGALADMRDAQERYFLEEAAASAWSQHAAEGVPPEDRELFWEGTAALLALRVVRLERQLEGMPG